MKKWFIVLLLIGVGFFSVEAPAQAQVKVIWDGAEIVKDQTGKMTFTKDMKVYKKDKSGKFVSMVVKKGNYLRAYDVEKYDGKVFYWMSSGYRVQSTNLVVFKAIPLDLRSKFFKKPQSVNINRNSIDATYDNSDDVFTPPVDEKINIHYGKITSTLGSQSYPEWYWLNDPTDIKLVESIMLEVFFEPYKLKEDTIIYDNPFGIKTANAISIKKDAVVENYYYIVNGYMQIVGTTYNRKLNYFIQLSKLEKVK